MNKQTWRVYKSLRDGAFWLAPSDSPAVPDYITLADGLELEEATRWVNDYKKRAKAS